jgi:uncharacterized protein YcgL (UPF0745 family)
MIVRCRIYKSTRREEMYLYLRGEENFDDVPDALLAQLGRLELVMELDLHAQRKLARADVRKVMESLDRRGYFLQMPPAQESPRGEGGG